MMDEAESPSENDNSLFMDAFEDPPQDPFSPEKPISEAPPESDQTEGNQDDSSSISTSSKPYSRRARLQARANEMASKISAGRAKMNELLWNRRHGKDGSVELAVEAERASDISDEEV